MRRPKKITTETIDKLNKTIDRIEFLKEKIRKADEQNIKFAELIIKMAKADKN